jgi:hypothetical protein
MFAWLRILVGPLVRLLRRPAGVDQVVEAARELADTVHGAEPAQPLTHRDVEHIHDQIDSATVRQRHTLPGPVKAIDRSAKTPPARPPRIPRKGDQ